MKHDNKKTLPDIRFLPMRKTLLYFSCFLVWRKIRAEIFLTSLLKIPDKSLSKERVNLFTSSSLSSLNQNSKHLAQLCYSTIAIDQVVYRMAT